jgi:hypothetical protein
MTFSKLRCGLLLFLLLQSASSFAQNTSRSRAPQARRVPASVEESTLAPMDPEFVSSNSEAHWGDKSYRRRVGVDTLSLQAIGTQLSYGEMFESRKSFWELSTGWSKGVNSASESLSTSTNVIAKSSVRTYSNSGSYSQGKYSLGGTYYWSLFRDRWIFVYWGVPLVLTYYPGGSYKTGTRSETVANTDAPTTYSVSESAYGTISYNTNFGIDTGLRLGSEFYIRHLPHLAIGLAGALFVGHRTNVDLRTQTRTRSFTVTDGTEGTAASDATVDTVVSSKPGRSATSGANGGSFNLMGNFSLRYIF